MRAYAVRHHAWLALALVTCLTLLAGCASLGLAQPQTFSQRLAVAYTSVSAVRATATNLLQARSITVADAENIQRTADEVRAGLDVSRSLVGVDPKAADQRLGAAVATLEALRTYLQSRGTT